MRPRLPIEDIWHREERRTTRLLAFAALKNQTSLLNKTKASDAERNWQWLSACELNSLRDILSVRAQISATFERGRGLEQLVPSRNRFRDDEES